MVDHVMQRSREQHDKLAAPLAPPYHGQHCKAVPGRPHGITCMSWTADKRESAVTEGLVVRCMHERMCRSHSCPRLPERAFCASVQIRSACPRQTLASYTIQLI